MKGIKFAPEWIERAEVFLNDAEKHLTEGHFWLTCFEAHQSAEFYLKSLIVSTTGFHPYTHDLVELIDVTKGIGVEVGEDIVTACEILTPHYTLSRYPGRRAITYTRARAERCLSLAKKIVEWVKSIADP
ncbi:MAG: HEPN domain-containing protein [Desulfurococcaceae archaeon]